MDVTASPPPPPAASPAPLLRAASALMRVNHRPDLVFVRGVGSWLWDQHGRRYLDFVQGWAVNALGHAATAVVEAVREQSSRLLHSGPGYHNDRAIELAALLARLSGLDQVFFTNNGAEANEGAIKLARKYGRVHRQGAFEIITFEHGFHGRTLATMSASGKPGFDRLFAPQVRGFPKARLNHLGSVEACRSDRTVGVMLELVQGEAGVIEADVAFVQALRRWCDEHALLLIVDEVQTGIGRTGSLFAYERHGIRPDIVTLGKGLGGGVPIGAVLAREPVCCFEPGDQGGTFNGNPLVCAAALAVLGEVSRPQFLAKVQRRGERLRHGLVARNLGEVHGSGLLQAVRLPDGDSAAAIAHAALHPPHGQPGLLVNAVRADKLRLMPALNCTDEEIDQALDLLSIARARSRR